MVSARSTNTLRRFRRGNVYLTRPNAKLSTASVVSVAFVPNQMQGWTALQMSKTSIYTVFRNTLLILDLDLCLLNNLVTNTDRNRVGAVRPTVFGTREMKLKPFRCLIRQDRHGGGERIQ
jgi:hypothetical protein